MCAASCPCGCGKSGPASSWYYNVLKCDKGGSTQEWLDSFQKKERTVNVKGKPASKKSAESSSKASTPTKDGENAESAPSDEKASEKQATKKRKIEKELKAPKSTKVKAQVI